MLAASVAGYYVVQSELPGLLATVLAGELVTIENLEAGEPPFPSGVLYQIG
jgi:hypothetical protein